jgi:putative transcriptional regulator
MKVTKDKKTRSIGDALIHSMGEALAHAQGKKTDARETRFKTPAVEVKRIRERVKLTQPAFAGIMGVSVSGLRKWEQQVRRPSGAALTLLQVMDREPDAVARALAEERWLRADVAPTYDAMKARPERGVSAAKAFAEVRAQHSRRTKREKAR